MALTAYQQQTARLLHDPSQQFWSLTDLTFYINSARSQIAGEGQCVRVLAPSQGAITGATVVTQGTNYTSPTVTASGGLGSGATFTPTVVGGKITAIAVATAGTNYTLPTFTITDTTGTGATATAAQAGCLFTTAGIEQYTFSSVNSVVQTAQTGISGILMVQTVAVSWGSLKPVLDQLDWNSFQAYLRSYSAALQGQPCIWAQYGQGNSGSVYMWPIPSAVMPMDWDCICTPIVLVDDTTPEAIPYPWTDCVPYFAAYLALMNARRPEEAAAMFQLYENFMKRARTLSENTFVPSYYD